MLPGLISPQKGYIGLAVTVFLIIIAAFMYPWKYPKSDYTISGGSQYCREFVKGEDAPIVEYDGVTYKMIKRNVPVNPAGIQGSHHVGYGGNVTVDGKNFQVLDPTEGAGRSYDFNTEDGLIDISFGDYGLLYLLHLDASNNPETVDIQSAGLQIIDIYQDISKPPLPLQENILKCIDSGVRYVINPTVLVPDQSPSPDKDELQLEWFVIKQAKFMPKSWWTPECKPAVYLYPKNKQMVNLKVFPKGILSYTDPPYDAGKGWVVSAYPDGNLLTLENNEIKGDYLYYESKLDDRYIQKPEKGWAVPYGEIPDFYEKILPKLGLNQKEKTDFIEYWQSKLPESQYYFVGLVDKSQRDYLEPLEVTPSPDTSIRFSLYFQPLDQPISVQEPEIITPKREGFTLVDWGGMVKLHPGTPFTCSQ
jgi:hypothetical protein